MRYPNRWLIGEWAFYQAEDHGFGYDEPVYGYAQADGEKPVQDKIREWYRSLEHAMVAAVGEKYTGAARTGGTGVGTAADWFMRMIGAETLVEVDYAAGQRVLLEVMAATQTERGPAYRRARAVSVELEKRGLALAVVNTGNNGLVTGGR